MSKNIEWLSGNKLKADPTKKPKKITGTHFSEVLGLNPYATEFEAWCRCTRTYEKPFEGNKYTHAGEVIEPKVFTFLRESMGFGDALVVPRDVYGDEPFKTTYGDFFPDKVVFGGMWDALIRGKDGNYEAVVEIKTVQVDGRSGTLEQRWKDGKAPDYQALQASLYAYLLGVKKVLMVGVTLYDRNGDYEHPEEVVPSFLNSNVYIDSFDVYERYPKFNRYIDWAIRWWNTHVLTGESPEFDPKKDEEILTALRTKTLNPETDIKSLISEAESLKSEIDKATAAMADKTQRYKELTDQIKTFAINSMSGTDKYVQFDGTSYKWTLTRVDTPKLNEEALKADGLYEKYITPTTTYRFTVK